jgi:multidrug resistance efflux pump
MSHQYKSYEHIYGRMQKNHIRSWSLILLLSVTLALFLPWTQNIRAGGTVTALRQEHRPQEVNTMIGGRIEKWYVREGDHVKKGDTLVLLSETRTDYLDPQLLDRTSEQLSAKQSSLDFYESKVSSTAQQVQALGRALEVKLQQLKGKLQQARMKLQSDSMDMVAAGNDFNIASLQFRRQKALFDSGLVSLTQLEQRNQFFLSSMAKKTAAENRFSIAQQELLLIQMEYNGVQQEYAEKMLKAESDRFGALSVVATGRGEVAKLQNQFASYRIRNGMYCVLAPQDGQVVQARRSGIGEVIKEGDMLLHIVPNDPEYAVEMYVRPVDLPLMRIGQPVRFMFDGFPAIVFSGWPAASYGTFQGTVSAIEQDISANGKFKVLVREDAAYRKWPPELSMGTGARGIALIKDVPVWYELWRNINAFPPDYPDNRQKPAKP